MEMIIRSEFVTGLSSKLITRRHPLKDKYVAFDVHSAIIAGDCLDEKGSVLMYAISRQRPKRFEIFSVACAAASI